MTKLSALIFIAIASFASIPPAKGKTDVRALVGRPPETSKRQERKCKVDSDCLPIACRTHCGFDGVVNKKSFDAVSKRCEKARAASGDEIIVDCAPKKSVEKVFCKRRYCAMTESFTNEPPKAEVESEEEEGH